VHDVEHFGTVIALVAAALLAAIASSRLTARLGVPAPAVFLVAAAVASDLAAPLRRVSFIADQRIVTVALAIILFDGGMHVGLRRLRPVLWPVVWLGTAGTLVSAAALAVAAHGLFSFGWRPALLLGTALAPTDPAVVFSVLGKREIGGRTGTLLEGESGANDPVGIALMISVLGATDGSWSAVGHGVGEFALQMAIGSLFGAVGGWLILLAMRSVRLPSESLYPVQALSLVLLLYGVATAAHGSGFLAVFIAGIVVGDAPTPYRRQIRGFSSSVSTLGEIVAFVVLGLSVSLHDVFHGDRIWTGLALAALLVFAIRPLLVGAVLWPVRLTRGERLFVLWAGLKGAVPILLGTYVVVQGVTGATRIYDVIFVVVTASVIVQGTLVPSAARLARVPMGGGPTRGS
jgi:cell volume regulation protein A